MQLRFQSMKEERVLKSKLFELVVSSCLPSMSCTHLCLQQQQIAVCFERSKLRTPFCRFPVTNFRRKSEVFPKVSVTSSVMESSGDQKMRVMLGFNIVVWRVFLHVL